VSGRKWGKVVVKLYFIEFATVTWSDILSNTDRHMYVSKKAEVYLLIYITENSRQ